MSSNGRHPSPLFRVGEDQHVWPGMRGIREHMESAVRLGSRALLLMILGLIVGAGVATDQHRFVTYPLLAGVLLGVLTLIVAQTLMGNVRKRPRRVERLIATAYVFQAVVFVLALTAVGCIVGGIIGHRGEDLILAAPLFIAMATGLAYTLWTAMPTRSR